MTPPPGSGRDPCPPTLTEVSILPLALRLAHTVIILFVCVAFCVLPPLNCNFPEGRDCFAH